MLIALRKTGLAPVANQLGSRGRTCRATEYSVPSILPFFLAENRGVIHNSYLQADDAEEVCRVSTGCLTSVFCVTANLAEGMISLLAKYGRFGSIL
jgi:hypothetical protein